MTTEPTAITADEWQERHDYGEKYIHTHTWMFLVKTFKNLGKFEQRGLANSVKDWLVDLGEMYVVNMYEIAKRMIKQSNVGIDNVELKKAIAEVIMLSVKGMLAAMKGLEIDYMNVIMTIDGQLDMHKGQLVREYNERFSNVVVE